MHLLTSTKKSFSSKEIQRQLSHRHDSTSYVKLKDVVDKYKIQVILNKKIGSLLPWVHIAINNAKRMLLDIHQNIYAEHLQNYLNEFCYNFNRRYFDEALFDRLHVASISNKNQFRYS